MESSGTNEVNNNITLDGNTMERKDKPETDASDSKAIQELIRMDLAEKAVMNTRMNATPPSDKEPGAFEGIHLPQKEEGFLNDVHKQINTLDLPQNNNDALSNSEAIQELLRTDLEMKQQPEADLVEAVGLRLRPILRPSSTSDSENTENENNSSSSSKNAQLIEAEMVGEGKAPEPVFRAQEVNEEEIECQRRRVRTIILSSIALILISVVVVVSLVLRFAVFKDNGDDAAAQTTTAISTKTTSAPTFTPTSAISTKTLSPTPYTGTTWVQKGQFIHGTMEEQELSTISALSNDGSLLALPSAGVLDLGPLQGSFQMYRFDEMIQQWVPRGSRVMGKTAYDLITGLAMSGNGDVLATRSPLNGACRTYEWDETANDWSEREGNITAKFVSISDDGYILATVTPQTEEQTDGALIKIQIWNETEKSWIPHGKTISIGEHVGQSGLHTIRSLSLDPSGTRFVAGANGPLDDDGSIWGESIWAYAWNGTDWTVVGSTSIDFSEVTIANMDCSFECKNIAVGLSSSSVSVYAWKEDDNTWETKGQLLTGRNITNDIFGYKLAISIDGSRLAALGRQYLVAYEWTAETNTWNQLGAILDGGDPTIAEQERYASDFCMSGDGNTMALAASDAEFVNATHTIPIAGRVEVYEWPSS